MQYKIFGCKTNKYFTDQWAESLFLRDKKGVFVSSCIVTDKAKSKWIRFVKQQLKVLGEWEKIYLSGCGALKNGMIDTNFYVIYPELAVYCDKIELLGESPPSPPTPLPEGEGRSVLHTKKFVVIQTGCDNFCTFCLTIQARGRQKSRDAEDILSEIREFVAHGGKEVVLTGTNIGAWGMSSTTSKESPLFAHLVERILRETQVPRLRISSLGIEYISDRLLELFREPRINPYIHLSVQSGSDMILRSMNRQYTRTELLDTLEKIRSIRRIDNMLINIGADIIVGFPGETESDFEDTVGIVRDFITQLHAFPFSPHREHYSVPAGSFANQIPEKIKSERLKVLLALGEQKKQAFLKMNDGKRFSVLVEGKWTGWTPNYIECTASNFTLLPGYEMKRGEIVEGVYKYL